MNHNTASLKLASIFKEYWIPIVIGVAGLICLGYGLIYLLGSNQSAGEADEIVFEASENPEKPVKKIMIDIEGAVVSPGVYSLNEESRIQDVLILAGGLSPNANREWMAKNLNLAARLSDAMKIYIPSENEEVLVDETNSGQININSASESELDTLYGVGPATAKKIIDNRPYQTVDDLLSKKAVTDKVFEQIKDSIVAY